MSKAVVFLADGFEEIEALSPVDYLRRAGVEVTTVAVGKSARMVEGSHGIGVNADMTLDSYLVTCTTGLPDAVVVPGGMPGSANIAGNAQAVGFVKEMLAADKLICAICAAPALVLPQTGALDGKKWTCYPGMQENAGEYASSNVQDGPFVHDGNLITGRGPGAAEQFAMEIVKTLCGEETYSKIRAGSVQR